jgi:hypothetical protein
MLNIKRIDKITYVDLYSKVGEKELSQKVFERQLTWVGHALRRPDTEPCRIFALYEPDANHGITKRGRRRNNFKQHIASLITTQAKDLTIKQIEDLASDRKLWKKLVIDRTKR